MKVQIINLDPHDDYVSTLDKLGWAKAPRILIVWPRHGRVLTRRLDLVLLQRKVRRRGSQIGLVTHDLEVIAHAEDLAIPVFDSLDLIPEQGWHVRPRPRVSIKRRAGAPLVDFPPPHTPSPLSEKKRILIKLSRTAIMSLAVLSLVLMIAALLPRAMIIINPETQIHKVDLVLTLDPEVEMVQPDGRIPARWAVIRVEGSLRSPTTGSTNVPATFARGTVIFTNRTSELINIPSITGLRASRNSNLRFETTEEVNLSDEVNAQASATIIAASPGPSGNLHAGAIDAIEGPLGLRVVVTNPTPTHGGENVIRAAVAPDDLATLESELIDQLVALAATELKGEMETDETLVEGSLRVSQILEKQFDRQVGEPADSVSLSITMEFEALIYRLSDLEAVATLVMENGTPQGASPVPGTSTYVLTTEPMIENSYTASLQMLASQDIFITIDEAQMRELLRAHTPDEASSLMKYILGNSVLTEIHLTPKWFPWLPWLGMNISINYPWEVD